MNNNIKQEIMELDVFIKGEVVDLCVPSKESWVIDRWYQWFNDEKTTRYLAQGIMPNTADKQIQFLDSAQDKGDRLILLIKPKNKEYFVGVASLSMIDHVQRKCDFAMVIGEQDKSSDSIFYAIETKCIMTEHAFEKIGVERIYSGQHIDLIKWQRWQFLFGYQIEGILRKSCRKGYNLSDSMVSSCLLEDYLKLKKMRNGSLWPGKKRMFELLREIPSETMIDRLHAWLKNEWEKTWVDNVLV
ncbi:MAG: GNAT family protein [Desulfobacula sp.]|jgi:RimJ/RimL family protein N-acetyltransferase